mmetsp:Transcript_7437/g.20279  ORF Transcript_7437/g.20279 Transcript_7437/m.20279 type:complete len:259 (+) Transcript_7437:570-1346(+)
MRAEILEVLEPDLRSFLICVLELERPSAHACSALEGEDKDMALALSLLDGLHLGEGDLLDPLLTCLRELPVANLVVLGDVFFNHLHLLLLAPESQQGQAPRLLVHRLGHDELVTPLHHCPGALLVGHLLHHHLVLLDVLLLEHGHPEAVPRILDAKGSFCLRSGKEIGRPPLEQLLSRLQARLPTHPRSLHELCSSLLPPLPSHPERVLQPHHSLALCTGEENDHLILFPVALELCARELGAPELLNDDDILLLKLHA